MTHGQSNSWTWSLKDSVVCGFAAALTFCAAFGLGAAITSTLGTGMSGFLTIIITTMLVIFGAKIVGKGGALLLIIMLFSFLAIPTTLFGPPGFQKLMIGLVIGILYELAVFLGRKRTAGYVAAGGLGSVGAIFAIWLLLQILGQPGASKLSAVIKWIWLPYGVLGCVGAWLGVRLFTSLQHLRPIQNLRGTE